jgi:hypothetical protein
MSQNHLQMDQHTTKAHLESRARADEVGEVFQGLSNHKTRGFNESIQSSVSNKLVIPVR